MSAYYTFNASTRRLKLTAVMDVILAGLSAPITTSELVDKIAPGLGVAKPEYGKLSRDVVALAPLYEAGGRAVRGSESFQRYGREMRPWRWLPPETVQQAAQCLTCPRVVARELLVEGVCPNCRT